MFYIKFTFMHLADAFIQSDSQCIQATLFYQYVRSCLNKVETQTDGSMDVIYVKYLFLYIDMN